MKKIISLLFVVFISQQLIFAQVDLKKEFDSAKNTKTKVNWQGTWTLPSRFYGASLKIKVVSTNKFTFMLESSNGANMGDISGTAKIKGKTAFFDDRLFAKKDDNPQGCQLLFEQKGQFIKIKENYQCHYYQGNAVTFAGDFYKGKPAVKERDFFQYGIFSNQNLDNKFKALTGKDYELFLDSFHLVFEEKDTDGFNAKVYRACVRGVCPYVGGIIMYDESGRIWAAVSVEGGDVIRYFTTESEWSEKLPETVQKWKDEFNSAAPVEYKSKK